MSNKVDTNYLLVKKERTEAGAIITAIVRSYLSDRRAFQDMELLQDANPEAIYDVIDVAYIDD